MSLGGTKAFLSEAAKERLSRAVKEAEATTACELVVCVRPRSASYRDVDLLVGAGVAWLVLVALLFDPLELDERHFPIDVLVAFGVAAFASSEVFGVRLVGVARRRSEVSTVARAESVRQGISATKGRTGVLVYASLAERLVEIVADVGVPAEALGKDGEEARGPLEAALRTGDVDGFARALEALGRKLGDALPRRPDDENELPDEVT